MGILTFCAVNQPEVGIMGELLAKELSLDRWSVLLKVSNGV